MRCYYWVFWFQKWKSLAISARFLTLARSVRKTVRKPVFPVFANSRFCRFSPVFSVFRDFSGAARPCIPQVFKTASL
jgi:hypothetical protein